MVKIRNDGSITLNELFRRYTEETAQEFSRQLSRMRDGDLCNLCLDEAADKPVKGLTISKRNGKYMLYAAKDLFDTHSRIRMEDCYTRAELSALLGDGDVLPKLAPKLAAEGLGKVKIIGPLSLGEAVSLRQAIECANTAAAFQTMARQSLRRLDR